VAATIHRGTPGVHAWLSAAGPPDTFGDASVPYRTCLDVVDQYDESAVLDAISRDLEGDSTPQAVVRRSARAPSPSRLGVRVGGSSQT
jgi:hypothetical protein